MDDRKIRAYRQNKIDKTSENSTDENQSQKIYVSVAHMSNNAEIPRRNY